MIQFFATVCAKWGYVWRELKKSAESGLNAKAALQRVAILTADADALEAHITTRDGMEEKGFWQCENGHEVQLIKSRAPEVTDRCPECFKPMKLISRETMSGQDKYESDKERKDATDLLASKRTEAGEAQKTAQYFTKLAAQSRDFADRLRKL